MAVQKTRSLPLAEARKFVNELFTPALGSISIFDQLEQESLIEVIQSPQIGLGTQTFYRVRFTFERFGDHFIANSLLEDLDQKSLSTAFKLGGKIHFAVANADSIREHQGLIEALSIEIAEKFGSELPDIAEEPEAGSLVLPMLRGLQWRGPGAISPRTVELMEETLATAPLASEAMESLFKLANLPNHPLNVSFIENFLSRNTLTTRDPIWAFHLSNSFHGDSEIGTGPGAVFRNIEWALKSDLMTIGPESAKLWAEFLAWCCASPDRKIRDKSTKGLVRIFLACPESMNHLLIKFFSFDDEYIEERVVIAVYGALLLDPDKKITESVAAQVWETYFKQKNGLPLNASIRDHSRLILELARDLV